MTSPGVSVGAVQTAFKLRPIWLMIALIPIAANKSAVGQIALEPPNDSVRLADAFHKASKQVLPAIVTLETQKGPRKNIQWAMYENPSRRDHYLACPDPNCDSCNSEYAHDGTGTGVIIDRSGYILTCFHVIASAHTVIVRLSDGRKFIATTVGVDPGSDVAVLRIPGCDEMSEIYFGDSDDLRIGDWAICVANPFGLGCSISAGVISATDRELPDRPNTRLLQTDAATNPGSSGGVLINLRGQVVGITEGAYGANEGFQGIGFAIPSNFAHRIATQLIKHGQIRRARLGCTAEPVSTEVANHLGLPTKDGLIVTDVSPGSPADTAGIEAGDVLTRFSSTLIRDGYHLQELLEQSAGSQHAISIFRNGGTKTINVEFPIASANPKNLMVELLPREDRADFTELSLGLTITNSSQSVLEKLEYAGDLEGVLVVDVKPGSLASRSGICAGMVILRIAGKRIRSITEFKEAMARQSVDPALLLLIASPEKKHFLVLHGDQ